jgi:hypothetical protein
MHKIKYNIFFNLLLISLICNISFQYQYANEESDVENTINKIWSKLIDFFNKNYHIALIILSFFGIIYFSLYILYKYIFPFILIYFLKKQTNTIKLKEKKPTPYKALNEYYFKKNLQDPFHNISA